MALAKKAKVIELEVEQSTSLLDLAIENTEHQKSSSNRIVELQANGYKILQPEEFTRIRVNQDYIRKDSYRPFIVEMEYGDGIAYSEVVFIEAPIFETEEGFDSCCGRGKNSVYLISKYPIAVKR